MTEDGAIHYNIFFEDHKADITNTICKILCDITESLDTLEEQIITIHIIHDY